MSVLMALALLAQATSLDYSTQVPDWKIMTGTTDCSMATSYDSGAELYVTYNSNNSEVSISVLDKKFASIERGTEYDLKMVFVGITPDQDRTWPSVKATGMVLDEHTKGFMINGDTLMLDAVANSQLVGFKRGNIIVDSLRLKGSKAAVAVLRRCAAEMARLHPIDPFAP